MPKRYIPALIIFIALLGAAIYSYQIESSYINAMEIAAGEVVSLGSKSTVTTSINGNAKKTNTQAIVNFTVNDKTYTAKGRSMGYPYWQVGQSVEVYYSVNNPKESRINRIDELYNFTLWFLFFISASVLFATINFIVYKVRGRPLS